MINKSNAAYEVKKHYKCIQCVLSEACALPVVHIHTSVSYP